MSDVLDTVYQSRDLDGELHWLGDSYARERLDDTYTKEQSDELFRRIDDSYSSNDINDMMMSKADKADVYTKTEIDTQYEELIEATDEEFTSIRSTIAQLRSDTEIHFQNVEDTIDNLGDTYYNKDEVNAIAEELDLSKQNTLVSDGSIILTEMGDGRVEIGTATGVSLIDDGTPQEDKVWSSSKTSEEIDVVIEAIHQFVPIGMCFPYTGNVVPSTTYWLKCDGSEVSRETYSALFQAIGTLYGAGDGSTTFNLPDLRDRTIMGATTGKLVGTVESDAFASHTHIATQGAHNHGVTDPGHTHTQEPHNHGITDPGHNHTYANSGFTYDASVGAATGGRKSSDFTSTTGSRVTGITINNSTAINKSAVTGITIDDATPAITVQNTGDNETRPKNIRMDWYIKCV